LAATLESARVAQATPSSTRRAPGQRAKSPRPRTSHRRRWIIVAVAVPTILIAAIAGFGLVVWQRIDRVHIQFPGSPAGGTTYLLIGSDARDFVHSAADRSHFGAPDAVAGERADIILLVRKASDGQIRMLGIPRDLVTQFPDGSPVRMTLTLLRGPQTVDDTLCHSLGIGVDHLVLMHFDGLRRLVGSVGGVTVHVPAPERDLVTGLRIPHAGAAHLNGDQALAYVRSRRTQLLGPSGWRAIPQTADARSQRARDVLAQLGARIHLSAASPISSIERLWSLSGAITVDDQAGPFVLRDIARSLNHVGTAPEERLPVTFHPGEVPTADLLPTAAGVIGAFQGGQAPGCSLRTNIHINPSSRAAAAITPSGGTP
jgi:LCP family protein required for cell wall assembly